MVAPSPNEGRNSRKGPVFIKGIVALVLLAIPFYFIARNSASETLLQTTGLVLLLEIAYLLLAYHIRVEVDTDNLGWIGGLVNNPFSFKDDLNRGKLFLNLILAPGRVLAEVLVDAFREMRQ